MRFLIKLTVNYDNDTQESLLKHGYKVIFESKLFPVLIGVENESGNLEELLQLPYVRSASMDEEGSFFS